MANPYLVGGLSEGVERGLGIYQNLEQMKRQREEDKARAADREQTSQLRGLQISQAQMQADQAAEERQTQDALLRAQGFDPTPEGRAQAAIAAQQQAQQAAQAEADMKLRESNAKITKDQAAAQASRAREKVALSGLKTAEEQERFVKILPVIARWQQTNPEEKDAVRAVGAALEGKIPMDQVSKEQYRMALGPVLYKELFDRANDTEYTVDELLKGGHKLPPAIARQKDLVLKVQEVDQPDIGYSEERDRFNATTKQTLVGEYGGRKFNVVLDKAIATKNRTASGDDEVSEPTLEQFRDRFRAANATFALLEQLRQAGVPDDQAQIYVATEGARLKVPVPEGAGLTPPKPQTPAERKAEADARLQNLKADELEQDLTGLGSPILGGARQLPAPGAVSPDYDFSKANSLADSKYLQ